MEPTNDTTESSTNGKRPRTHTRRFTVRLDEETGREVERLARDDARDVGAMLRVLVGQGIKWRKASGNRGK